MSKDSPEMKLFIWCAVWCALLIIAWPRTSWPLFTIAVLLILRVELLEHEHDRMLTMMRAVKDDIGDAIDLLEDDATIITPKTTVSKQDNVLWMVGEQGPTN